MLDRLLRAGHKSLRLCCDPLVAVMQAADFWNGCLGRRLSSRVVTKLHHAAPVGFDLRQMESDVSVEFLEEWDPFTN